MTTITLTCPYCGADCAFELAKRYEVPRRKAEKLNCTSCNSRFYLDLGVRRGGKSAAVKRKEAERLAKIEAEAKWMYEATENSLRCPFSELQPMTKRMFMGQARRKLEDQGDL